MKVTQNKSNLNFSALKSFPTFKNEIENEMNNSSDRNITSRFSSFRNKNSSAFSINKSKQIKSESCMEKEYCLDYTPSFSSELDLSKSELENSFKIKN